MSARRKNKIDQVLREYCANVQDNIKYKRT